MSFTLSSPDFANNKSIPMQFTCEGANTAPTLNWQDPPAATRSFALIMDDPDATHDTWVHWVVFNIPATAKLLTTDLPKAAINATNSWGKTAYGGPCPATGTHRYFFKLYALDTTLSLNAQASKEDLIVAMQGHILATTELIGLYQKAKH